MMEIQDKNEIIAQITYNSIKKKEANQKTLTEFGYFTYFITFKDNCFCMGFNSEDFNKIYEYSGKTYIENEFKEYKVATNEELEGKKWPIVLKAPLNDYEKLNKKKKKYTMCLKRDMCFWHLYCQDMLIMIRRINSKNKGN